MKIVHAADLHLDSPLVGLDRYEGAPVERIRLSTRRALSNLVDLCIAEGASLLLLAGDLYDGSWKDYSTGLFFVAEMQRLREAGVAVASVRGNHDAVSQITTHLRLPDNVHDFDTEKAQTRVYEELGIAVHGQGFASRSVTTDLARSYPTPLDGALNIGLLHTSVDGRPGHAPYAPTRLGILQDKGYAYWALGHVHQREILSEAPWVVFPGNLQGRHAREAGDKGATVVSVERGAIQSVQHRALDVVRFGALSVDATDAADRHDVLDACRAVLEDALERADGRLLCCRVTVVGRSAAHEALARDPERLAADLRALSLDVGADSLWVERVQLRTGTRVDLDRLRVRDDAIGHVARAVAGLTSEDVVELLADDLDELRTRLPTEVKEDLGLDETRRLAVELLGELREALPSLLADEGQEP